ncbi:MAG TPA: TatD family hydrolase [Candidatus Paceibacterota bacterium]
MEIKFVDAHGHLNFPEYDIDREAVIERCREKGVLAVTVSVDTESSCKALELAKKYPDVVRATAGLHPMCAWGEAPEAKISADELRKTVTAAASMLEVVAVGECGLDYARLPAGDEAAIKLRQREVFIAHIEAAAAAKKPLMIHCRDAYDDVLGILEESRRAGHATPANFHFYSGDEAHLKRILDAGDTVSFTGVITFASSYDSLVQFAPLDRILSETDCPYVTPAPHRGKRNEPTYVEEVVKRLAVLKGLDFDPTATILLENARRVLQV